MCIRDRYVPMRSCAEHEFKAYVEQDDAFYNFPIHEDDIKKMPDYNQIKKQRENAKGPEGSKSLGDYWLNSVGDILYEKFIEKYGEKKTILISAEIENQINQLDNQIEKGNYMKMINMKETGLNNLIKKGYDLLSLETFFTSGPEESRAWTITKNCTAPKAAGEIHTDFEKGFIRAETVSYKDFVENEGWLKARESGKMRLEGKDYIVNDGDVLNFRFNT